MTSLQREVLAVVETCRATLAIPKRLRPSVDSPTVSTARAILDKAKHQRPHDENLAIISMEVAAWSWWTLLFAMETLNRALLQNRPNQAPQARRQVRV
jgi:hypothetical protein